MNTTHPRPNVRRHPLDAWEQAMIEDEEPVSGPTVWDRLQWAVLAVLVYVDLCLWVTR